MPKLNWAVIGLVLLLTAGLLYGGYKQWQLRTIQNPLLVKLNEIDGVLDVDLSKTRQKIVLKIGVSDNGHFPQIARQIYALLREEEPGLQSEIIWSDSANESLQALRSRMDLMVSEAQWQHEFMLLQARMTQELAGTDVSYQLGVDEDYIFLCLQEGDKVMRESIPLLGNGGGIK